MSVREFTLLLSTTFLCKYTKVMWLCKSKGFHNSFLRVYYFTLNMIWKNMLWMLTFDFFKVCIHIKKYPYLITANW